MKKLIAVMLVFAVLCPWITAFAAETGYPPRVSVVIHDAVMAGESLYGTLMFYTPNGVSKNLRISEENFSISGTGRARITDIGELTTVDGMTYTARFRLVAEYPGEIKLAFKNSQFSDRAGLWNTGSVPKYIDIKIFNTDGDKADEKMTESEYFITVIIAPFWYVLHLLGIV